MSDNLKDAAESGFRVYGEKIQAPFSNEDLTGLLEAYTSRILASQQAAHDAEIAELRREVAMLRDAANPLVMEKGCNAKMLRKLQDAVFDTRTTAEAFIAECEQRGVVKAHQEYTVMGALHNYAFYPYPPFPEGSKLLFDRATSKKAG